MAFLRSLSSSTCIPLFNIVSAHVLQWCRHGSPESQSLEARHRAGEIATKGWPSDVIRLRVGLE